MKPLTLFAEFVGLMQPAFPCLPKGTRTEADLLCPGLYRLSPWRHDQFDKPLTLQIRGSGDIGVEWDPPQDTRPELTTLPPHWAIRPNGFYQYTLPTDLSLTLEDFFQGEKKAFEARLDTPRRRPGVGDWANDAPFLMNAEHCALKLYHYMKQHIPGFAAINGHKGYNPEESWKRFVLVLPGWGEIYFWNFGGELHADNGAVLRAVRGDQVVEPLWRQNPGLQNDICYEGDENRPYVGFELPKQPNTADNIITIFAVVHAIGRLAPAWADPRGEWDPLG